MRVNECGTDGAGKPIRARFTARFDGKYYPVEGSEFVDEVSMARAGARTIRARARKAGKEVFSEVLTAAPDGHSLAADAEAVGAGGENVRIRSVYVRAAQ